MLVGFDMAMERAEEIDCCFEEHNRNVGPLHGLSDNVKDQWHIEVLDTSMAYTGWIGSFEGVREILEERGYSKVN